jgi:hypothetical protein
MLPAYLINLLVYYYLHVKNYKMAVTLVRARRFIVDIDNIETTQTTS